MAAGPGLGVLLGPRGLAAAAGREGKGRVLRWVLAACGKWRGGQRAVFMGGRLAGREKVETGRTVRRGLKREGEERWETRRTRRKRE